MLNENFKTQVLLNFCTMYPRTRFSETYNGITRFGKNTYEKICVSGRVLLTYESCTCNFRYNKFWSFISSVDNMHYNIDLFAMMGFDEVNFALSPFRTTEKSAASPCRLFLRKHFMGGKVDFNFCIHLRQVPYSMTTFYLRPCGIGWP